MSIWTAPRMWEDGECWIIGGGTSLLTQLGVPEKLMEQVWKGIMPWSAYDKYFTPLKDKHLIGVNNAYRLGQWVDVVFFGDNSWYMVHREQLYAHPSVKVTCLARFVNKPVNEMEGIKCLQPTRGKSRGLTTKPNELVWNFNSGAAAINLAIHFGVKRIYLLGFDMMMDKLAVYSHWFGYHTPPGQRPKRQPPFSKHLKCFPYVAKEAEKMGVEIINVNPDSKIEEFPKKGLTEIWTDKIKCGENDG